MIAAAETRSAVHVLAASALALTLAAPAAASTLDLYAKGEARTLIRLGPPTYNQDYIEERATSIDGFDLGPPDGTRVETFRSGAFTGGTPFPPGTRNPLVSAVAQDDGLYGAGVSSGSIGRPGDLTATAELTYTYINEGSLAEYYQPELDIPIMSVGLSGYAGHTVTDLRAQSDIYVEARTLDRDKVPTEVRATALYSLNLRTVGHPSLWITDYEYSPALERALESLGLRLEQHSYFNDIGVNSTWVTTLSAPAFSVRFAPTLLQPGEMLEVFLNASAIVDVGIYDGEQGGEAFAGDPFHLVRSPGPVLTLNYDNGGVTPSPVPLPASGLLLLGGVALMGGLSRRGGSLRTGGRNGP